MKRHLIIWAIFIVFFSQVAGSVSTSWAEDPGDECWSTDYYHAGVAGNIGVMFSQPGAIYIGGYFTSVSGVTVQNVARLEMSAGVVTQVVPLGEGLNSSPKAFCEHDGGIIAAGNFTSSGTTTLNKVAKWDGSTWQPLGEGLLDIWPKSAVSFQGQLYVDNFRWDGTDWIEAFPTNGSVSTLTVYDGLLYVGGSFTEALGQPHLNVFAWDGNDVQALGAGFPVPISFAAAGTPGIAFSGFTDFGQGQLSRWDGTTWTVELDNTMVSELAYLGNDLVVSGYAYVGGGTFDPIMRTNAGGYWHGIADFFTGSLVEHEGILLARVYAGVEPGVLSPGLIGYNGSSMQEVFPPSHGFDGNFDAVAGWLGATLIGGDFQIADGQEFDGFAMTSAGTWVAWGSRSDLDTSFPGSFVELEVVGSEIFGVYNFVDYDVAVDLLVKLVLDAGIWTWELLDTGTYFYGDLQAVGSDLFNIGYGGVSQINLQTGFATPLPGTDLNGSVYDSCEYLGTMAICGSFTTNNGLPVSNVMRHVDGAWQNVGNPLPGARVSALATMEGLQLAACSWVDNVWRISIFDGVAWTVLPGDFDGSIYNLEFHQGRLFVAGSFDNVGAVPAAGIALWTGEQWAAVGSGLAGNSYGRVSDMESIGDNLFLTGGFTWSGGQPSVGLAKWTGDPTLFSGSTSSANDALMVPARLLSNAYPNPFNPNTRVAFVVPEPGLVQIGIFDLRGNRVRKLVDETFTPGSYNRSWNGLDDAGQALPSGMYFARMLSGHGAESIKLTLVR